MFFCERNLFAQGENNHWHFGQGHSINFNTTPPTYGSASAMRTNESCATVSDAQGNLLFYTMGSRVWDRNGVEMPNAIGLLGNGPFVNGIGQGSSYDCLEVVPHPGNPNQYFIFTGNGAEMGPVTIYCHVVDMSLNGGMGDVVAGQKNIVVASNMGNEYSAVARGDCNKVWLIVPTLLGTLQAYKIDQNGLDLNPVISTPNIAGITILSQIRVLDDGTCYMVTNSGFTRSQFNSITGAFSNFVLMPDIGGVFFELSPDNQKLYTGTADMIKQWDLGLYPNIAAIQASAVNLYPISSNIAVFMNLRSGPDGKLYALRMQISPTSIEFKIDRIEQPNIAGFGATYTSNVFNVQQLGNGMSFGSKIIKAIVADTMKGSVKDTMVCQSVPINLNSPHSGASYLWSDGSTSATISVSQSGVYYVYSTNSECKVFIDSFKVEYVNAALNLGNDTTLCAGDVLRLNENNQSFDTYLWSDGSSMPYLDVRESGRYDLIATKGSCRFTDTIVITFQTPTVLIQPGDTFICENDEIKLSVSSNFESVFTWNTGATGNSIKVNQEGTFVASAQNVCGKQTDTVNVSVVNCDCKPIMPNAFSPNGDGKNDVFIPQIISTCETKSYDFRIYNRYGQVVFSTNQRGIGWDGTYKNGQVADLGVYYYVVMLNSVFGNAETIVSKGDVTLYR